MNLGLGLGLGSAIAGGGVSWSPNAAFFAGNAGFAYDPTRYDTMWQDISATSPITAVGQQLARIDDLSGNGSHRTQSSASLRPLIAAGGRYVSDGVDDLMQSTANTAAGGSWTHVIRINILSDNRVVFCYGSTVGAAFYGVIEDGSASPSVGAGATLTSNNVNGSVVANTRNDLHDALTGGEKTLVIKLAALNDATWLSSFSVLGYAGGYQLAGKFGRELLINRALSAGDLALAVAWVEAG